MKSGTVFAIGLSVLAAASLGVGMYLNLYVYYRLVDGVTTLRIGDADLAVSAYQGLDNDALPLRLRGCFEFDDPEAALEAGEPARDPAPFDAPFWFSCWDAAALDADLRAGRARARVGDTAQAGEFFLQRVVVVYPDGRGFQWRRFVDAEGAPTR